MFTPLLPPPGIPTSRNMEQRSNHVLPLSTNPNLHTGMTDKPEQAAPHSDPTEGQTAGAPQDREISPDKLKEILEQHRKWVETGGKEGKRADLRNANLQKANPEGGQPSPSGALQGPRRKAPHRSPDRIRPYTAFVRQTWGPHGQAGVDSRFLNYLRGLVLFPVFGYVLFMMW